MNDLDARRYTIKAVLGKGGYGKVYHAIMEGAGGFSKDVAIKLLNSEGVPELTLQRFRDEARILGLVRDRAIVNVDPPTRLAGRWAVVMEYVDGASLQRLIQLGPIPAGVVAEIVQEVARALDTVYRQPGPDGKPLCLLHRDIKPGNLQVTPDGGVKILDFGIARADFARREAETEAYIGGTRGFIAPERLDGMERPEGDIFSLGITAHCMLFGQRPTKHQMMGLAGVSPPSKDPAERALVTLFTQMRSVDPEERPTAREVEDRCGQIRHHSNDMSLRRWAERQVPRAMQLSADDAMVGSVLTETLAAMPSEERIASGRELFASTAERPRASRRRPRMRHVLLFGGLVLGTGALALTSAITAGVVLILQSGGLSSSEMVIPVEYDGPSSEPVPRIERSISSTAPRPADPVPNEDASEAAAANSADANPGDPPLPPPDPQAGESGGAVTTSQDIPATVTPDASPLDPVADATDEAPTDDAPIAKVDPPGADDAPRPPEPVAALDEGAADATTEESATVVAEPSPPSVVPQRPLPTRAIQITSTEAGAEVWLDDRPVGKTPIASLRVTDGRHQIRIVTDGETSIRTIEVGRRAPTHFVFVGGDAWEDRY